MIKEELEVDVAMVNGAVLKGDMTYSSGILTYAQLKAGTLMIRVIIEKA